MWSNNEIQQGDSGSAVSNALDAEFARIQQAENVVALKFADLKYTDQTTVMDKTQDKLIVSPWTLWSILDVMKDEVTDVKKVTDHLTEEFFDGEFWIRTDVMFEYSGAYVPIDDLRPANFITKVHLDEYGTILDGKYLLADGTASMPTGYVPVNPLDIATKGYVDAVADGVITNAKTEYIEYPPSKLGDTVFSAPLNGKNFVVYLNGVLWRRAKYGFTTSTITFLSPLDEDDEVTVTILGV